MGAEASFDTAYGVAIDIESAGLNWWDLPDTGDVISYGVGQYGGPQNQHLVITSTLKEMQMGESKVIPPYQAASEPYLTWDAMLVAAAEKLKVPMAGQPGWLVLLTEG